MTTLIKKTILLSIFIHWTSISIAQSYCDKSMILGNWSFIRGYLIYETPNLDSLLKEVEAINASLKYSMIIENEKLIYKTGKSTKTQFYNFDLEKCTLKIKRRETAKKTYYSEIIFLNDKYLVFKKPNPHNYSFVFYRRK